MDQASQRAFAGAGFANQAQRLARLDVERNIIDSSDGSRAPPAERRLAKIENLS